MNKYPEADKALTKSKVTLMCLPNTVFISTVLFNLKFSWNSKIPTARTNGIFLQVNPTWFMELSPEERIGLLAHEAWHVCWNHMQRGKNYDNRSKYNEAGDHVINLTITDSGMKIPEGGLCDKKYRGMSTGEIYKVLPEDPQSNGNNGQNPMANDVIFQEGTDEENEAANTQIQSTIIKAKIQHDMSGNDPGSIPGELLREIEEMIDPKLPWNSILQNHMNNFAKADYSFRKPNRRYFPDFYLPSAYSDRLENISVFIDLSGSILDEDLRVFLSEIEYIHGTMKPEKMFVGGFDTRITDRHEVTEFQDIRDLKFHGGGGTSLDWLPKWVQENQPTVLIIFSDMYVGYPEKPAANTEYIWIIIDNEGAVPPFGRGIHYSTEK